MTKTIASSCRALIWMRLNVQLKQYVNKANLASGPLRRQEANRLLSKRLPVNTWTMRVIGCRQKPLKSKIKMDLTKSLKVIRGCDSSMRVTPAQST